MEKKSKDDVIEITFSQSRSNICNEKYGKYGIKQTLCFETNNNLAWLERYRNICKDHIMEMLMYVAFLFYYLRDYAFEVEHIPTKDTIFLSSWLTQDWYGTKKSKDMLIFVLHDHILGNLCVQPSNN